MLQLIGLTVICVVADGASSNRKFFRLHNILKYQKSGVTYMAPNISLPGSYVFFMADVPHILKTTRNAWYNSQANRTRSLQVRTDCVLQLFTTSLYIRTMEVKLSGHTWLN